MSVPADPPVTLEALRARGAERLDPVRWRYLEALARRAAAQPARTQALLQARLDAALAEFAARLAEPTPGAATPAATARPLATLVAELSPALLPASARSLPSGGTAGAPSGSPAAARPPSPAPREELKTVRHFRRTWTRLKVQQRLTQARATVPDNAGPLNSQRLLHQALTVLKHGSPDYLHRLMQQVEALMWVEAAQPVGLAPRSTKTRRR